MKKIALLLSLITILGTASLAAMPGNLAVGATLGFASLKYQFTSDVTGSLGLNNFSGSLFNSATGILVKVDYNLAKAGQVQPNLGLFYTTNGAAAATTSLGITYGITTMVQPNLSLGADIVLLATSSLGGNSGTSLLSTVALSAAYYL